MPPTTTTDAGTIPATPSAECGTFCPTDEDVREALERDLLILHPGLELTVEEAEAEGRILAALADRACIVLPYIALVNEAQQVSRDAIAEVERLVALWEAGARILLLRGARQGEHQSRRLPCERRYQPVEHRLLRYATYLQSRYLIFAAPQSNPRTAFRW